MNTPILLITGALTGIARSTAFVYASKIDWRGRLSAPLEPDVPEATSFGWVRGLDGEASWPGMELGSFGTIAHAGLAFIQLSRG